jgi:hypothetical protein
VYSSDPDGAELCEGDMLVPDGPLTAGHTYNYTVGLYVPPVSPPVKNAWIYGWFYMVYFLADGIGQGTGDFVATWSSGSCPPGPAGNCPLAMGWWRAYYSNPDATNPHQSWWHWTSSGTFTPVAHARPGGGGVVHCSRAFIPWMCANCDASTGQASESGAGVTVNP